MQIAHSFAEKNEIDATGTVILWARAGDLHYGYETDAEIPDQLKQPPPDAVPPIKSWAGAAEFYPLFTLDEHAAVIEVARHDALVAAGMSRLNAAPIIRSDSPDLNRVVTRLIELREAEGGDENLPTREKWAALLAS